jgi:hypothetical protein
MRTVAQLISVAGGARRIAAASADTQHPIGFEAVYKWPKIGVPERHWPLLIVLTGATVQEIYDANRQIDSASTEGSLDPQGAAA